MSSSAPRRVLIVRLSAIGDAILTLPVACALRRHVPDAHLAWVVERKAAPVVVGHDALDDVVVLDRGWFKSPLSALSVRRRLREGRYDTAIDCQGLTKSALAARLSGAKRRLGFGGEHGRELSRFFNTELVHPRRAHVVDRSLELLSPLGVREPEVDWRFPIDDASRARVGAAARERTGGGAYAVANPSATWRSKRWETDRFAAVARHLRRRHGLPTLVVWGGERERDLAARVVEQSEGAASLAPSTDVVELAALLQSARVFVGTDAGPMHLAVAVGTPTVALHGPTAREACGPYGSPHVALQVERQRGTHRARRRASNDAMRRIDVEMVSSAIDRLLVAGV